MKAQLRRLAQALFKEYQLNRIYYLDMSEQPPSAPMNPAEGVTIRVIDSPEQIAAATDQRIREHAWYAGAQALGYGIWESGELVCMCWFWLAGHSAMPGRFPAVGEKEAVMVDLLTTPSCRGKGYAVAITRFAMHDLFSRGYLKLWTWIWHSNTPSIRVFTKAGWTYSHFLAEIKLPGFHKSIPFRLPAFGN
jgi:ribosomal protein S18 acetylase RimI-like enzyme